MALSIAAETNISIVVGFLLTGDAILKPWTDLEGAMELFCAIKERESENAQLLINCGANIAPYCNPRWLYERTDLPFAASEGFGDIGKLLTERGSDIIARDSCPKRKELNDAS